MDARNFALFSGRVTEASLPFGHIPGAGSLPYTAVLNSNGKIAAPARLRTIFQVAGVSQGDRMIIYCHVGREAAIVHFAARLLGYDARLYDGSWEEWSSEVRSAGGP